MTTSQVVMQLPVGPGRDILQTRSLEALGSLVWWSAALTSELILPELVEAPATGPVSKKRVVVAEAKML